MSFRAMHLSFQVPCYPSQNLCRCIKYNQEVANQKTEVLCSMEHTAQAGRKALRPSRSKYQEKQFSQEAEQIHRAVAMGSGSLKCSLASQPIRNGGFSLCGFQGFEVHLPLAEELWDLPHHQDPAQDPAVQRRQNQVATTVAAEGPVSGCFCYLRV